MEEHLLTNDKVCNEWIKNNNNKDKMHECFYEKEYLEKIITITEKKTSYFNIYNCIQIYISGHPTCNTYFLCWIHFLIFVLLIFFKYTDFLIQKIISNIIVPFSQSYIIEFCQSYYKLAKTPDWIKCTSQR